MISVELAKRLRDGGVRWNPAPGDRFVVADRDMDAEVFTISDMTVEIHTFPGNEQVIGFNGTVEWALDSVEIQQSVWLPSETQLRVLLGGTFRRLEPCGVGWRVLVDVSGREVSTEHGDASEAYGLALLHLATGEAATGPTVG